MSSVVRRSARTSVSIFEFIGLPSTIYSSCTITSLKKLMSIVYLQDIELSKEINESFKQSSQARTKLPSGIEMSVHVLTTG